MSPQSKLIVCEQPVDVVQVFLVVLGLVPMSGCGWDLILMTRSVAKDVSSAWSPLGSVSEKSSPPSYLLPPLPSCSRALT